MSGVLQVSCELEVITAYVPGTFSWFFFFVCLFACLVWFGFGAFLVTVVRMPYWMDAIHGKYSTTELYSSALAKPCQTHS